MTKLPLEGIRVLDVGDVLAGPFSCTLLADWGAEVIKVESIQRFTTRGQLNPPPKRPEGTNPAMWGYPDGIPGERPWNRHPSFNGINRNKFGVTLNLRHPTGVDMYKRLVAVSDVIIENYAYGVMERLGIGYEVLSKINPHLIMVSLPQFGNTGPYKAYRGWGDSADAMSGHLSLRGYEDQKVELIRSMVHTDASSSSAIQFAVTSALYHRSKTGKGQFIDFGQCENFMPHLGEYFMDYFMNDRVAGRLGNRHRVWAPHGCYPAQPGTDMPDQRDDKWITLTCRNEEEWGKLVEFMGNPDWARQSQFASMASRKNNEDELDTYISKWTKDWDHYDLFHKLQAIGIPSGPVLDFGEAYSDPHLNDRQFFEEVAHREAGTQKYPGMTWKMSKSQGRIRIPANCLGEHNHEILKRLIGLSQDEITQLESDEIIGNEFLPGADQ